MAAQRDTGLADEQVVQLREDVTAGRRPRVRVSGPQFPSGTIGTVVRVGDPSTNGGDFIRVRVKVGGVTDELGFSPRELSKAGRGRAATRSTSPAVTAGTQRASSPRSSGSGVTPVTPTVAEPARLRAGTSVVGASTRSSSDSTGKRGEARPPAPAKAAARSQSRAVPGPAVTFTITSSGTSWSVSAHRGARVLVKKASVSPGVVAAVAALLDQPGVEDAVAAVNDTARGEAEARAEKLRAELAEVEAVLISHRRP
jgi:hypothetical protein